jgi:TetR/AcrR family transcriptional repressor of nem operon
MPWEKQFDTDAALDQAMRAFWAQGYEATSIRDLLDCMGINRGSLYATYGDKRQLFIRALHHYDARHRQAWTDGLAESHGPKAAILGAFEGAIAAALDDGPKNGCLLVNTALELSPHDPEIGAIVAEALTGMEGFFQALIERGQAAGEIPAGVDPADTARALLGLFVGLRVLSRSRPEAPLLRALAVQADALIS